VLLPVFAAFAAALIFYLLIPVAGAFRLRGQWRRFRQRVAQLSAAPVLRYGDLAAAEREGRKIAGRFRLYGTVEALEGPDRVWVRGKNVSALVDLSKAPLYVSSPGPAEAGTIERLSWGSVSSVLEGTSIFVGGQLELEEGKPVFVEAPEELLVAVCHDSDEKRLISRLVAAGRAQNEYWNYPTIISLALGVAAIAGILLLSMTSTFSTLRALIFLAGALPIMPFAPPGLALFFAYHRLWRQGIALRAARDLFRLPLKHSGARRELAPEEEAPEGSTSLGAPQRGGPGEGQGRTLFSPADPEDPSAETFVVTGDPETLARRVELEAGLFVAAAGLSFALAVAVNFALAFAIWRTFL
jgi:hypothetical protein